MELVGVRCFLCNKEITDEKEIMWVEYKERVGISKQVPIHNWHTIPNNMRDKLNMD